MPGIHEVRRMPYSARQMYDLVADVGRYQEFLPWVVATRVRSDDGHEMVADMLVGFKALKEKFTSRVVKREPEEIRVLYVDGPMRDLDNRWIFHPVGDHACDVEFDVQFSFRNRMFEALAGQYFDKAFRKMVAAFEERAAQLYGPPQES
jgi:coenzyme Q-binding protein COQ10